MANQDQLSARLAKVEAVLRAAGYLPFTFAFGDAATLGGYPASYFAVAGASTALVEQASAPPTADATNVGTFYYYRPASSPGQLLFSQRDSAGGYEWTVVAQASL
jgi:hypothetical protein